MKNCFVFLVLGGLLGGLFSACNNDDDDKDIPVPHGKYKYGTFVLNEGSTWKDVPGSLVFISPDGEVTDSVYYKENGEFLGAGAQDLYIKNNKLYIVSQKGGNDGGVLTIANAETLKKERAFQEEWSGKQPTHVAVLSDDDVYVRVETEGVYRFAPSTATLTLIENTAGARKTAMAVVAGKVFAAQGNHLLVIEAGQSAVSKKITVSGAVTSVIPSADGNIWFACAKQGDEAAKIMKLNVKDYTMQVNPIEDEAVAAIFNEDGFFSTSCMTAKGDTLYMSGGGYQAPQPLYRHIFSRKETKLVGDMASGLENVTDLYNGVAVHPVTGMLYANLIADYEKDPENKICVFDVKNGTLALKKKYQGYTMNPAGIFFTYHFQ